MTQRAQDLVIGAAFLLAFPSAIHLTHLASSEPGQPGRPSLEQSPAASAPTGG
ncbi:hypothetical protein [Nocardioides coralli]|uniref:hypothetical protein n=1 Tax=Nocardioides coralli TaxID=2872154 RepID=UPI001CA416F1|nr:hypothetical protein [Nocardioides coralli]QZY29870.1 hypothetical protein K6T13_04050 [Nocardioides coralli]